VCELDGPTPIFNISKTEMHSSIRENLLNKYKAMNRQKEFKILKNLKLINNGKSFLF
jgi:hypothetical protein